MTGKHKFAVAFRVGEWSRDVPPAGRPELGECRRCKVPVWIDDAVRAVVARGSSPVCMACLETLEDAP
jgi:hypothetical protein